LSYNKEDFRNVRETEEVIKKIYVCSITRKVRMNLHDINFQLLYMTYTSIDYLGLNIDNTQYMCIDIYW